MTSGFSVDPASIDGSAHQLIEIAALLYEGRLDRDVGTLCRVPNSPEEIAKKAETIARFADDQYGDLVLLLIALSTKLSETSKSYLDVETKIQTDLDRLLAEGHYVAPKGG